MPGMSGTRPVALAIGDHLDHGLRAVDEFDQHARVHVARPRLGLIGLGHGIDLQRVVLALAGGDDLEAEALSEADELERGRRLVARRARVDDARRVAPPP